MGQKPQKSIKRFITHHRITSVFVVVFASNVSGQEFCHTSSENKTRLCIVEQR